MKLRFQRKEKMSIEKKTNVEIHKEKLLKNSQFKEAYENLGPVYSLIREIISYRIQHGITQKELADRIGTQQSSISRFEKSMKMPSISFLTQITNALGLEWDFHLC